MRPGDLSSTAPRHVEGNASGHRVSALPERTPSREYAFSSLMVLASTLIAALLRSRLEPANLVMIYLLGVICSAVWWGRGPAAWASVLSVAVFDFFFVP